MTKWQIMVNLHLQLTKHVIKKMAYKKKKLIFCWISIIY